MRRIIAAMLIAGLSLSCLAGCQWMGRQSGKAVETVKESPGDFEKGYDQGKESVKKESE